MKPAMMTAGAKREQKSKNINCIFVYAAPAACCAAVVLSATLAFLLLLLFWGQKSE